MLAAILTVCGSMTVLTSCTAESDNPVALNPLGDKLEGLWYVEYDAQGTINNPYTDSEVNYTRVVEIYDFDEDSVSVWNRYFFEDNDEEPVTDLGGGSNGLGAFSFISRADGTVNVTLTNTDQVEEANRQDYLPLTRTLRVVGDRLTAKGLGSQDIVLQHDNGDMEQKVASWNLTLHGGSGYNPNNMLIYKFDYDNWRQKNTIFIYDGVSDYNSKAMGKGYQEVALPWANTAKQTHIPEALCDEMTQENGWEMALNYCGRNDIKNANFIFLYNKYTGILRVLYYMPEAIKSGSDHLWEVVVPDNMALRSPWRYGLPNDFNFTTDGKTAIGQKESGHMQNLIVPWNTEWGINGAVDPKEGWWAFDIDMSQYRPGNDITKDNIKLLVHSWDNTTITLKSQLKAQIKSDAAEGDVAGDVVNGLKALVGFGVEFMKGNIFAQEKKAIEGVDAIASIFGTLCGLTGDGGNQPISLGMTGDMDTQGFAKTGAVTTGIPSPTIPMSYFDFKHTHLGQGVWNLKSTPKIYITNQFVSGSGFGCVWFFNSGSIDLELNPEVFPKEDIDWVQVDAFPGARADNKVIGTDNHRKFLGLHERHIRLKDAEYRKHDVISLDGKDKKAQVLANYNYGNANKDGMKYPAYFPEEEVNGEKRAHTVYGYGTSSVIFEPQLGVGGNSDYLCSAPPVEINVRVIVSMKGKLYAYNRPYLPEVEYIESTQENLEKFYKERFEDYRAPGFYHEHVETHLYNKKRAYDKIKYLFPKANLEDPTVIKYY